VGGRQILLMGVRVGVALWALEWAWQFFLDQSIGIDETNTFQCIDENNTFQLVDEDNTFQLNFVF